MINNLLEKSLNEKYHKSIRYFSHSLKGLKRSNFIVALSEYNIYLAAQCVMSSEKDDDLEASLISKAELFARDFENAEKSAKGFLALAEFGIYEKISNLFENILNPSSIHLQVFSKILENNDSNVFCSFLPILVKANKSILIQFAISAYNGELHITDISKRQVKLLLDYLISNKTYGLLRMFLKKFNLMSDLDYILGISLDGVIKDLSNQKIRGIKLAYELVVENNLLSEYSPEFFIRKAAIKIGKKPMVFSIEVANKHELRNIKELDNSIKEAIRRKTKTGLKSLRTISEQSLLKYFADNEVVSGDIVNLFKAEAQAKLESISSLFNDAKSLGDKVLAIENEIVNYILEPGKVPIQEFIELMSDAYEVSYKLIVSCLAKYEFTGLTKRVYEYGILVSTVDFRSIPFPFLHRDRHGKDISGGVDLSLKVGQEFKFKIVNMNINTKKLYIKIVNQEILSEDLNGIA